MLRAVGRAFSAMITAFFLALLALDLYIVVQTLAFHNPSPSVLGWRQLVISSGSMEPAISVGDLILVRRQPAYHEGEVVTYRLPDGAYITHRIIARTGGQFILQGDANNTADEPVDPSDVLGRVERVIPRVGNFILWLKTTPGMICIILAGFLSIQLPRWLSCGRPEPPGGRPAQKRVYRGGEFVEPPPEKRVYHAGEPFGGPPQ
ncbi:signal peptidase I [Allofournierella sp.]|uniref:signal peptidase I n=1 Tax=Allofournierella sp. TaxID=1940256 RepID=UPI003AB13F81